MGGAGRSFCKWVYGEAHAQKTGGKLRPPCFLWDTKMPPKIKRTGSKTGGQKKKKKSQALRRDETRQAIVCKERLQQRLQELEAEVERAQNDGKAVYAETCQREAKVAQGEAKQALAKRDKTLVQLQTYVTDMEAKYEEILHDSVSILKSLALSRSAWFYPSNYVPSPAQLLMQIEAKFSPLLPAQQTETRPLTAPGIWQRRREDEGRHLPSPLYKTHRGNVAVSWRSGGERVK